MAYCGWQKDDDRGASIYDNYLNKLVWFVGWLLDRGYRVRLLTGDSRDWQAVDDVRHRLAATRGSTDSRLVAEPASSLHELMRQLADTSIVVATRYHNLICALKLGKPTISVGYGIKNDVLLAQIGLDEFCQQINNLHVQVLVAQFLEMAKKRSHFAKKMEKANVRLVQQLRNQEEILLQQLFGVDSRTLSAGGDAGAVGL